MMSSLFNFELNSGAILSDDNKYRYKLWRIWDVDKPKVLFIMLNPSTADHSNDDPTIRRCIGFAKSWGYGSLYVGNLFAYRATNPTELLSASNPTGDSIDRNQFHLDALIDKCDMVVCAWGNTPLDYEVELPFKSNNKFHHLGLTKSGNPRHPLYLKKTLKPIRYE